MYLTKTPLSRNDVSHVCKEHFRFKLFIKQSFDKISIFTK